MHRFAQFRPRRLHWFLCTLLALPVPSFAIEVGETYVESGQNQPLSARINVTDIDPASFSVNLANPQAYRQLGLNKASDMAIRFEPTSSNGGMIVLTSRQPINAPFTDVLLTINNAGQTRLLPKTLLLPLDSKQRITPQSAAKLIEPTPTTVVVGNTEAVQLPVINEPLLVKQTPPPPLPMVDAPVSLANADTSAQPVQNSIPNLPQTAAPNVAQNTLPPIDAAPITMADASVIGAGNRATPNNTPTLQVPPERPYPDAAAQAITAQNQQTAKQPTPQTTVSAANTTAAYTTANDTTANNDDAMTTYVVERNDNLWTIASDLAKQSNTDVHTIMQRIVEDNPQAFANNDPSQLYANAKLAIPATFDTRPSKRSVNAANQAQVQKNTKANSVNDDTRKTTATNQRSARKTRNQTATSARKRRMARAAERQVQTAQSRSTKRRAEMTIITPSQQNGAAQGGLSQTGKGNIGNALLSKVKSKRQATAQQARTVGQLNQNLIRAENRLQIQNTRLAQLEQRLKQLNQAN